jgi:hypothetical protein
LDTRAGDLLRGLGLDERLVSMQSDWDACPAIDYNAVDAELEKQREHSLAFLRKIMKRQ